MNSSQKDKLRDIIPLIHAAPGEGSLEMPLVLAAHERPAVTSVRVNPHKPGLLTDTLRPVAWTRGGYYLEERPVFTLDPLFHAGAYYVQEASSMFTEHAFRSLAPKDNSLRILDLCAAPGGKSTLLASLLSEEDLLVSNEVIQQRASVLAENMSRWGQMNTWVSNNDPRDFARLPGYFDVLLADAPCTGSGLWRKDEAALGEWSEANVKLCSERQKRILADALPALKPGGLLLYATCSYSIEENEEIAAWLNQELGLEPLDIPLDPAWHIRETTYKGIKGYRFYPWQLEGEGFFLAAFRKEGGALPRGAGHKPQKAFNGSSRRSPISKTRDDSARWSDWLHTDFRSIERNGDYYAIPAALEQELSLLQAALRIKKTGTALGRIAGKDIIPDHELALSVHLSRDVNRLDVGKEEALLFLKKEEIRRGEGLKGWQLVTYSGLGLGWGKWLPNRMNNYFPKNWRIRMDVK